MESATPQYLGSKWVANKLNINQSLSTPILPLIALKSGTYIDLSTLINTYQYRFLVTVNHWVASSSLARGAISRIIFRSLLFLLTPSDFSIPSPICYPPLDISY